MEINEIVALAKQIENTKDPELRKKLQEILNERVEAHKEREEAEAYRRSFDGVDPHFYTIH